MSFFHVAVSCSLWQVFRCHIIHVRVRKTTGVYIINHELNAAEINLIHQAYTFVASFFFGVSVCVTLLGFSRWLSCFIFGNA